MQVDSVFDVNILDYVACQFYLDNVASLIDTAANEKQSGEELKEKMELLAHSSYAVGLIFCQQRKVYLEDAEGDLEENPTTEE